MIRVIAVPSLIFTIGVACLCDASAGPITYFVEPVSLSNGYTIDGGHITVADPTEALEPEDIIDYEVRVSGPIPHTFGLHHHRYAGVGVTGVVRATESNIAIGSGGPAGPEDGGQLRFSDGHFLPQLRTWVRWSFWWEEPPDVEVVYGHGEDSDGALGVWDGGGSHIVVARVGEQEADFDTDGDTDGDDFLIWQAGFNVDDRGDANGDGVTDGDDFLIWQSQFGSGSGSARAAVPEPASVVLLIAALICVVSPRHRR